jgi:BirA family transcriptional regulator, biotin operon repressor / biotin---[acetyl-CoA-carboxylase] ligase
VERFETGARVLGTPRAHFRLADSTNARARELAGRGAPHGTVVTAAEQSEGRGRQGRTWSAPAGRALLCSIVIREPPELLPLAAGVAVADVVDGAGAPAGVAVAERVGGDALIKWPNDVLLDGRKVAGILVEARLQEGWAVVGIGVNVAVRPEDYPPELRDRAGTLGLDPSAIEPTLTALLRALERWVGAGAEPVLKAVRARDALLGREVRWGGRSGIGAGIDGDGRLVVRTDGGEERLDAGEVHLGGE